KNLCTLTNWLLSFGEKCGAPAEEHSAIRRQAVVVEIIFRVVDHPVARAQLTRQRLGQNFGRDDVRTDGNNFFLQPGRYASGITAGTDEDIARTQRTSRGTHAPALGAVPCFALDLLHARSLENRRTRPVRSRRQSCYVPRPIQTG